MTVTQDTIAGALAGPYRPLWRVTAKHSTFGTVDLSTLRSQLTFDEQRAPYGELRVDAPVPGTDLDRQLDPRLGIRLLVHAGYHIDNRDDTSLIADLGLRDRSTQSPEGTGELNAATDEALVIDTAASRNNAIKTSTSHVAMLDTIIGEAIPSPVIVNELGSAGGALSWAVGTYTDKWQAIEDVSDSLGDVWVYCDEYRRWRYRNRPTLAATPTLRFADPDPELASVPLLSLSSTQTRESWANLVFLRYRWRDGTTDNAIDAIKGVTSGPYANVLGNRRTYTETRTLPTTQARADAAATSLVKRLSSRGRVLTLRAPACWWLRPGDTIGVQGRRHLVGSVMFDSAGWMEVRTRYPDPANATIG